MASSSNWWARTENANVNREPRAFDVEVHGEPCLLSSSSWTDREVTDAIYKGLVVLVPCAKSEQMKEIWHHPFIHWLRELGCRSATETKSVMRIKVVNM